MRTFVFSLIVLTIKSRQSDFYALIVVHGKTDWKIVIVERIQRDHIARCPSSEFLGQAVA
jgi:hypothetical protein